MVDESSKGIAEHAGLAAAECNKKKIVTEVKHIAHPHRRCALQKKQARRMRKIKRKNKK